MECRTEGGPGVPSGVYSCGSLLRNSLGDIVVDNIEIKLEYVWCELGKFPGSWQWVLGVQGCEEFLVG
jgi:hypothetical protein